MAGAVISKKLTNVAAITGGVLAVIIFFAVGWIGISLMTTFFLLATATTSWKKSFKQRIDTTQENKERRDTGQVLANGGAGGILGVMAFCFPLHTEILLLMMAAAFSSATADTISSELGTVYGKKFYDILSFRKGQRGLDGVISVEGLLFGIAGSSIIAFVYASTGGWNKSILWIIVAGTIGNLADSYLGAILERKGIISNNTVNFLNTAIAAVTMWVVYRI
jgi:uncharacterized protein (TIGR00297 family)